MFYHVVNIDTHEEIYTAEDLWEADEWIYKTHGDDTPQLVIVDDWGEPC